MACCCNDGATIGNNNCCCSLLLVQVNRVFNGARLTDSIENETFTLFNFSSGFTLPLTYIRSEGEGNAIIQTQTVTLLGDGRSRVAITYLCPVTVFMRDANNLLVTASITIPRSLDIILRLPTRPFTFEVAYAFLSRIGTVNGDESVTITGCLLTVVKVLVKCEVLIKPCGCVTFPDAVLTEDLTCQAVFNTDI